MRALGDHVLLRATDHTMANGLVLKTAFVVESVGDTVPIKLHLGDVVLYNEEKAVPLDPYTVSVHYTDLYAVTVEDLFYDDDQRLGLEA